MADDIGDGESSIADVIEKIASGWPADALELDSRCSPRQHGGMTDTVARIRITLADTDPSIWRRTYKTREAARQDGFDYVEMFHNPVRKHVRNGMLPPVEFERQQMMKAEGV